MKTRKIKFNPDKERQMLDLAMKSGYPLSVLESMPPKTLAVVRKRYR